MFSLIDTTAPTQLANSLTRRGNVPNTLAHIAVNGIASRTLGLSAGLRWIYAGAVLPDIPWIMNRLINADTLGLDPVSVRSYFIIQSSLIFCLLLSICGASLSRRFRNTFLALGLGSFLHLLLDAMQTKWGNGVILFAPLDWNPVNFGLFWPNSIPAFMLTGAGLVFFFGMAPQLWRGQPESAASCRPRISTLLSSAGVYFLLPLVFIGGPIEANAHFLGTIRDKTERVGKYIELDRALCMTTGDTTSVRLFTGESVHVLGIPEQCDSAASIRGVFVAQTTIQADDVHLQSTWFRDGASYVGLSLIMIWWLLDMGRFLRQRKKLPKGP